MTYFGVLLRFIVVPIIILGIVLWILRRRGRQLPHSLQGWPATWALLGHIAVALLYTTPWDNYLVATRVWWYDVNLVTGIVIGWVPIEEYTFFILQTVLSGFWLLLIARFLPVPDEGPWSNPRLRKTSTAIVLLLWVAAVLLPVFIGDQGNYLALELGWALPPIALQLGFGADILWRYRRLAFWSIVPATLYLSVVDALAIQSGTWTINPEQTVNIELFGVLPLEEFIFFLVTNIMVGFGMTLVLARESHERMENEIIPWSRRLTRRGRVQQNG